MPVNLPTNAEIETARNELENAGYIAGSRDDISGVTWTLTMNHCGQDLTSGRRSAGGGARRLRRINVRGSKALGLVCGEPARSTGSGVNAALRGPFTQLRRLRFRGSKRGNSFGGILTTKGKHKAPTRMVRVHSREFARIRVNSRLQK